MQRLVALFSTLLAPALLFSSEFRSGQAARAVIGQPSFSVATGGITPTALSLSGGKLFVTDNGQRVLSYDVSSLLAAPKGDRSEFSGASCAVCIDRPSSVVPQSVISEVSRVSTYANSVAIVDPATHRVLLWRDSKSSEAASGPDVILGSGSERGTPVSGNTLVDPISVALDGRRLFVGDAGLHRVLVWNSLPTDGSQPADVVLGQPDMSSSGGKMPGPARIVRPSALVSDGKNLFVADAAAHRVLMFSASEFSLSENGVLNSATGIHGSLAPGTLVSVEGENLTSRPETALDDGEHALPYSLAGIEVLLDGRPLPLLAANPHEIRCQLPYDLHGAEFGTLAIREDLGGGRSEWSNAISIEFRSVSPGVLAFAGAEPRAGISVHFNSETRETSNPVTASEPARPGEPIVLWASGMGAVIDGDGATQPIAGQPYTGDAGTVLSPVQAELDGQPLQIISAILPRHSIGIYQVQVLLPRDLPSNASAHLTLSQGEVRSNTVTLPIGNPVH
ncbi:MAG: hypothetical protein ACJ746_24205 [Bryobacteraceae bacterium]